MSEGTALGTDIDLLREPGSATSSQVCGQPVQFGLHAEREMVRRQRNKSTKLLGTVEGTNCPGNSGNAGARDLYLGE